MGKVKSSPRLLPFIILAIGIFIPFAFFVLAIALDIRTNNLSPFYLFFVYFSLGWIVRYIFIAYDMLDGNVNAKRFWISTIICLAVFILFVLIPWKPWIFAPIRLDLVVALNFFPLVAFFSRKPNAKEEILCVAIMLVTSIAAVLLSDSLFVVLGLMLCLPW